MDHHGRQPLVPPLRVQSGVAVTDDRRVLRHVEEQAHRQQPDEHPTDRQPHTVAVRVRCRARRPVLWLRRRWTAQMADVDPTATITAGMNTRGRPAGKGATGSATRAGRPRNTMTMPTASNRTIAARRGAACSGPASACSGRPNTRKTISPAEAVQQGECDGPRCRDERRLLHERRHGGAPGRGPGAGRRLLRRGHGSQSVRTLPGPHAETLRPADRSRRTGRPDMRRSPIRRSRSVHRLDIARSSGPPDSICFDHSE